MRGQFYRLTRELHLYLGLFISPFVLVFAISVFFLVHSWRPRLASETSTTRVVAALPLPADLQTLSGRPLIDALKPALAKADVPGDVGFVRHMVKEEKLIDDPRNTRDWALTSLWAYSMDAVAAGLIFMVLSSVYMWLELPQKRLLGAVVLGLGSIICALFCVGLRWLF